jgi:FHS family L-fucose permease-like MFS transporter
MLTKIPEPHMETAEEKAARLAGTAKKDKHSPLSFRHFVLGAIAIFFYVGIEVSIPNTANVHFSGLDWVGPAIAGTFVSAYWLCMLFGRLIGASVGGKVSSKKMLLYTSSVAILFILLAMFIPETVKIGEHAPLSFLFLTLCGLCTSVMWGAIFNLSAEGLGKYTAAASGIFMTLVCGGGIIPFIQNAIADKVGSIQSYWLLVFCLAYLIFYAVSGSKNVNKDIPV